MKQVFGSHVQEVVQDEHRAIIALLNDPDCISVSERGNTLRRHFMTTMVKHFVAEERYLYPAVRRHLSHGDDFTERAVATNRDAEMLLARLGDPTLTAMGLADLWKEIRGAFATHVGKQDPILNALAAAGDPDLLIELGLAISEATDGVAVTRPLSAEKANDAS